MNGNQWILYNQSLPNTAITELEIVYGSNTLKAARSKDINLYPTPTADVAIVETTGFDIDNILIMNTLGQDITNQILITKLSKTQHKLNLQNLSTGIYYLQINNRTKTLFKL